MFRFTENTPLILNDDEIANKKIELQNKLRTIDSQLKDEEANCHDAGIKSTTNCLGATLLGGGVGAGPFYTGIVSGNQGALIAGISIFGCAGFVALANIGYGLFNTAKYCSTKNKKIELEEQLKSYPEPRVMYK